MDKKNYMCYITYAVPADELQDFLAQRTIDAPLALSGTPQKAAYPEGFVPSWFLRGSFPEDDID